MLLKQRVLHLSSSCHLKKGFIDFHSMYTVQYDDVRTLVEITYTPEYNIE